MKTMKIFEPAMCCSTGLCGVSVDPELLRVSTVLNTLKQNGIEVQRFNLTSAPMEFVNHPAVSDYLKKFGPDKLPVVLVEDCIVIAGRYPTNAEFASWLDGSRIAGRAVRVLHRGGLLLHRRGSENRRLLLR